MCAHHHWTDRIYQWRCRYFIYGMGTLALQTLSNANTQTHITAHTLPVASSISHITEQVLREATVN